MRIDFPSAEPFYPRLAEVLNSDILLVAPAEGDDEHLVGPVGFEPTTKGL